MKKERQFGLDLIRALATSMVFDSYVGDLQSIVKRTAISKMGDL